jgi:NhaP-type Na+/H+ and K+/H+ antiporter
MVSQGVREGYDLSSTFFAVVLLGCGMFGLLVVSGSYVGLVRSETTLVGPARRLVDAAVITCIGILVPFAFRYHLWWVIGSNNNSAGIPQLVAVLAIFAILIFSVTFAVESHLRLHSEAP